MMKFIYFIDILLAIAILPFFFYIATSGFLVVAAFFIILIIEMMIDYARIRKYFVNMMLRYKCEVQMTDDLRAELSDVYIGLENYYHLLYRAENEVKKLKYDIMLLEIDKRIINRELGKELRNENKSNSN